VLPQTWIWIAAVAEAVHAAGATPMLCETPGTEFDVEATYAILGLEEFCRKHDIGMVRKIDRWLELRPAGARRLKRFHVPAQLADACLINLPVLKTHVVSGNECGDERTSWACCREKTGGRCIRAAFNSLLSI